LFDWIENHCSSKLNTSTFIRALTTVIIESIIEGSNTYNLNEDQLRLRSSVLIKFLNGNQKMEMHALFALQHLVHRLEHPNKLLHTLFEKMYDYDVVSEEAFLSWEKSDDPAELEGKGVALKSCNQFFTWLHQADMMDDGY